MISGAGLCWQHVGGVGSTTTTTTSMWKNGYMDKKKEAYKEIKKNPTEETKNECKRLKKTVWKAVARAMKEETVRRINKLGRNPNVFRLVRKIEIESSDVGGRYMREMMEHFTLMRRMEQSSGKTYVKNKEWDQIADADSVEGPIERVMRKEIMVAF